MPQTLDRVLVWSALATLLLGLALLFVGTTFSGRPLPKRLRSATLAMELPRTAQDIFETVGADNLPEDQNDRAVMARIQYLDFPFIGAYVTLFVALARLMRTIVPPKFEWIGFISAVAICMAGMCDILEDVNILGTLQRFPNVTQVDASIISAFAWPKWLLVFVSVLCFLPLLFRKYEKSAGLTILSALIGVLVLLSGATGLYAVIEQRELRLESASYVVASVPIFVLLRALLKDGAREGLNRIASWPVLVWIARWPDFPSTAPIVRGAND